MTLHMAGLGGLVLLGAGGFAAWAVRGEAVTPVPAVTTRVVAPELAAAAAIAPPVDLATAPAAAPAKPAAAALRLPDGTTVAALNGVTIDLEVPWPAGVPWSPIVGREWNGGTEFYRHADGSFTTTIVRTETVSGRELQIPLCYTPKPAPVTPQLKR